MDILNVKSGTTLTGSYVTMCFIRKEQMGTLSKDSEEYIFSFQSIFQSPLKYQKKIHHKIPYSDSTTCSNVTLSQSISSMSTWNQKVLATPRKQRIDS